MRKAELLRDGSELGKAAGNGRGGEVMVMKIDGDILYRL